ncbi:phosphatase PAP2 family protein [Paenibacillus sp. H1-7]|uniref:phosphatase PAP2 family protein n=1 Tax=Paenibacillus sp. H1-7 TaxID=2282849 RepID=UPI001EF94444|nr:phosphatase PAP2 family protein [Paenibacillus sp. H1-7]
MNSLFKQLSFTLFLSLLCAVGFGWIAMQIGDSRIDLFDSTWISIIQGTHSPVLTYIMRIFSYIGAGIPATVLALLVAYMLYRRYGYRRELIFFLGVLLTSWLLNESLKLAFQRTRPTINRIAEATGYSFPSGHSMAAFTFYGILAFLIWKHLPSKWGRIVLLLFSAGMIVSIGLSRIYLGVHYPSDVIGGFLASGCLITISIWYFQTYMVRRTQEQLV